MRIYVEHRHRSSAGPREAISGNATINFVFHPGPKVLSLLLNLRGSRRRWRANNKKQHCLYLNRIEAHQNELCPPRDYFPAKVLDEVTSSLGVSDRDGDIINAGGLHSL